MTSAAPAKGFLPLPHLAFQVLVSLAEADRHGYAIVKEVAARSGDRPPSTGSLYLSIARLLENGLIGQSEEPADGDGRRGRVYRLTGLGRQVAEAEADRLASLLGTAADRRLLPAGAAHGAASGSAKS